MTPADVSVVIPTLNEQGFISLAVHSARQAGAEQIIVVDGGSTDGTREIATDAGASQVLSSPVGRGTQLNRGAALTDRDFLLFLHADCHLGPECLRQICAQTGVVWGAFRQRIDSPRHPFRWIEWGNAMRVRYRGLPFGDQAMFVHRGAFNRQGGFDEIPLMEDLALSRRMRLIAKPVLLDGPVTISARRWIERGVIQQTFKNWSLQMGYSIGVSPEKLSRWY